jgi:hypothetical protein
VKSGFRDSGIHKDGNNKGGLHKGGFRDSGIRKGGTTKGGLHKSGLREGGIRTDGTHENRKLLFTGEKVPKNTIFTVFGQRSCLCCVQVSRR